MPMGTRIPTGKQWSPGVGDHLIRCGQEALNGHLRPLLTAKEPLLHRAKHKSLSSQELPLSLSITMNLKWTSLYSLLWFSGWGEAKRTKCLTNQTEQINPSPSTWPQAGADRERFTPTTRTAAATFQWLPPSRPR